MSPGGQHEHSHGSPHFPASMVRANHDSPFSFGCWPSSQGYACMNISISRCFASSGVGTGDGYRQSHVPGKRSFVFGLWLMEVEGREGGSKTILFFALDTILSSLAREQRPVCLSPIAPPSVHVTCDENDRQWIRSRTSHYHRSHGNRQGRHGLHARSETGRGVGDSKITRLSACSAVSHSTVMLSVV